MVEPCPRRNKGMRATGGLTIGASQRETVPERPESVLEGIPSGDCFRLTPAIQFVPGDDRSCRKQALLVSWP